MRKAKNPLKLAKEKARRAFSLYIRHRDSFDGEHCKCVSCGGVRAISEMQAGHFRSKGSSAALEFEETNCHAQCAACNYDSNRGMPPYTLWMEDQYGRDHTVSLLENRETVRRRKSDYEEIESFYQTALTELLAVRRERLHESADVPELLGTVE